MLWIALTISLAAVLWLARFDDKRRRTLGLPALTFTPPAWPVWQALLAPGVLLLFMGLTADFVIWMGAVCSFGWLLVMVTPTRWAKIRAGLDRMGAAFEAKIQGRLK